MKYRFISVIHYLKLDKQDCTISLTSGMISNNGDLLKEVLNYKSDLALDTMGVHSIDEFQGNTFYLVDGEFDASITHEKVDTFGTMMAFGFLRQIQSLTNDLWSIRDNSIYVRDGFLFVYDKDFEDGVSYKASLSTINTKSTGIIEETCFGTPILSLRIALVICGWFEGLRSGVANAVCGLNIRLDSNLQ